VAELLNIAEPGGGAPGPQWRAFLELGFRPLYLAGTAWAAVAILLWVYAPQALTGTLGGVFWHAHEMLWGFVATIAAGFLLTAAPTWTGMPPLRGPVLGLLCLAWLAARAGFLTPGTTAFFVATTAELLFFLGTAAMLGRAIYPSRNRRNYGVPLALAALGASDAMYLLAIWHGDHALALQRLNTGLLCMAVIALLIARRVIPFFAMRAISGLAIPMHTRSGRWQLAAASIAIVMGLLQAPAADDAGLAGSGATALTLARAAGLAVAGAIALVQVFAWRPWAVRRVPLLWVLYAGHAALGAGLLTAAAHELHWITRAAWPAHVIGVAGFSVLIIGMVTRTALGHLGRALRADRSMTASYALVIAAAALRLLALLPDTALPPAYAGAFLDAAAAAWAAAFALYLWRFVPMLIRPRAGQVSRPAKPAQ
jgi:uncharacterized protein involved in response to NO